MQKDSLMPEQIDVVMKQSKGKQEKLCFRAYRKGTRELLGVIDHQNSPVPKLMIVNYGVQLKKDILMFGHSSKQSSHLPLIGGHGSTI